MIHSLCYEACDLSAQVGPLTTSLHNGAVCVPGDGILFSGDDDYASLAPGQTFGPQLTFSLWVWFDADAHAVTPLLDFEVAHQSSEIFMGDFPRVILHSNGRVTSTHAAPTQQWVHVVATVSSTMMHIYLNGDLSASESPEFIRAKITTARFFCEQLLPKVHGLAAQVTAGHRILYDIEADDFD